MDTSDDGSAYRDIARTTILFRLPSVGPRTFSLGAVGAMVFGRGHSIGTTTGLLQYELYYTSLWF